MLFRSVSQSRYRQVVKGYEKEGVDRKLKWHYCITVGNAVVADYGYVPYQYTPQDYYVFGYQERWAEYRYHPALITGRFRSTAASTLDSWHLAQRFSSRPLLNAAFINEDPPIARVSAVNTSLTNQFIFDSFFNIEMARPMQMFSRRIMQLERSNLTLS